jgi:Major tropism determinant N-terminal domain
MARNITIQLLRGTFANMPALAIGEPYFTTDTHQFYVGTSSGNALVGPSGSSQVRQIEIDFGALPVPEASFLITDASVSPTSHIVGTVAYEQPTGKDLDELDMDGLDLKFGPGTGQFTLFARGQDGYISDKFKINYVVG